MIIKQIWYESIKISSGSVYRFKCDQKSIQRNYIYYITSFDPNLCHIQIDFIRHVDCVWKIFKKKTTEIKEICWTSVINPYRVHASSIERINFHIDLNGANHSCNTMFYWNIAHLTHFSLKHRYRYVHHHDLKIILEKSNFTITCMYYYRNSWRFFLSFYLFFYIYFAYDTKYL